MSDKDAKKIIEDAWPSWFAADEKRRAARYFMTKYFALKDEVRKLRLENKRLGGKHENALHL